MSLTMRIRRRLYQVSTLSLRKLAERVAPPFSCVEVLRPALWRVMRRRAREGDLPAWRQSLEMVGLALRHGIEPDLYVRARLSRRELRWPDKAAFLGTRPYLRVIDRVNPPEGRQLANKYASAALFEAFGIPTPRTWACLGRGGIDFEGRQIAGPVELERLVRQHKIVAACLKPVRGFGGTGFLPIDFEETATGVRARIGADAADLDLETLWETLRLGEGHGRLLQERVDQHPELAALHPASLNTARVWMERRPAFEAGASPWRMLHGLLRMGVGGACVDNTSQGGIAAPVDRETGILGAALSPDDLEGVRHERHPTTDVAIRGMRLPLWSEMEAFCGRVCMPFSPELRLLGVDVAFSRGGLLAIEVNGRPDIGHQVVLGYGFRSIVEGRARGR